MTPKFVYGTAWKELDTKRLVGLALAAGFRAIDTANQRKHYHEAGVGEALAEAFAKGLVKREDLWLQTKFTHLDGQDQRLPYDPSAPVAKQVEQSFARSLEHLGVSKLDSLVLHGPSLRNRLAPEDLEAWFAMEALQKAGKTEVVGVSNVTLAQLEEVCTKGTVKPAYVQNRCYASTGWDRPVRAFCKKNGIVYQGFSLLTANRDEVASSAVKKIATRAKLTPQGVIFRFAIQVGMLPLTGTKNATHMKEDLTVLDHAGLTDAEVKTIEEISDRR
ncbi:MAG: aldo/keto reductase family protein [Planctomycetota bacterium]